MEETQTHTSRIPVYDVAKFALILFVVIGHILQEYEGQAPWIHSSLIWIYAFHMPVFILISGHFSKATVTPQAASSILHRIVIPYIIFQLLYSGIDMYVLKKPIDIFSIIFTPNWMMWYLMSLFFWRTFLPYLSLMPYPIVTSLGIGLLSGFIPHIGEPLSFARTLSFLPFFVIGYKCNDNFFLLLRHRFGKIISIAILCCTLWLAKDYAHLIQFSWLFGWAPYSEGFHSVVIRAIQYTAAISIGLSLFSLLPAWKIFAGFGTASMTIYLTHGVFIRTMQVYDGFKIFSPMTMVAFGLFWSILTILVVTQKRFTRDEETVIDTKSITANPA